MAGRESARCRQTDYEYWGNWIGLKEKSDGSLVVSYDNGKDLRCWHIEDSEFEQIESILAVAAREFLPHYVFLAEFERLNIQFKPIGI